MSSQSRRALAAFALACVFAFPPSPVLAAEALQGIEQALNAALQEKRGITLYVNGQTIAGAVTRIEPGQWVELRNQQYGRIIVRLERIDGIAAP